MQPQSCKPDCIEASIRAESRWARISAWFRGQVRCQHRELQEADAVSVRSTRSTAVLDQESGAGVASQQLALDSTGRSTACLSPGCCSDTHHTAAVQGAWCAACMQRALDSQAGRAAASWAELCSQQVRVVLSIGLPCAGCAGCARCVPCHGSSVQSTQQIVLISCCDTELSGCRSSISVIQRGGLPGGCREAHEESGLLLCSGAGSLAGVESAAARRFVPQFCPSSVHSRPCSKPGGCRCCSSSCCSAWGLV